ncbi:MULTISPECIES: sensor histidine kinase [Streptomyces]|uniref:histidine kinase n=1 Tax=Streptomyces doudnae TaxID=3075536 RepID=A0ABD5EW53_9ACTN|nr:MULTISPECIES: histidine kinase [unclassified Streptomyces]MDT0438962.1 histidine kinase [Streptomyces sp. DSM 41981]MYQ66760.1 two-component sensor histidine kinase [Streptomyces sp. SID4950]SCE24876.1 Signal transduction histidine kinase [Streptomyces sp. SolWspMP-5a-2]
MNDTSQTQHYKPRSPEGRAAADALRGLRQDLFHEAFAYRPLPPMGTEGPLVRRLPGGLRERAGWLPHAVVVAAALFALLLAGTTGTGGLDSLAMGALAAGPILLTLVRPVGAFWLSMAATPVCAVLAGEWYDWPWLPANFFAHLVVLTVVAARTRPRTAAWMWLVTAAYGTALGGARGFGSNTPPLLFVSALALLVVTVRHTRRQAQQEVTAQQTVTAQERSRRTLLEERTTIARELHDVVAHHMSVVAIQAEAAPYRVENPPPELEAAFATIRENAVAALTELRRVLGVVRAADYEVPEAPQPTLADLDGLLANVRDAGLDVGKTVTGAVRELPQGVELSAYRIVQEALSNTLRHAPGARASVEVGYVLGGLGLRIVNGPPPQPSLVKPSPGAGHGITGMRERVGMLDGEMTAGATAEGGYEVTVFLPVARAAEDAS